MPLGYIDQVVERGHKTQTCTPFVPFCLSIFVNPTFFGGKSIIASTPNKNSIFSLHCGSFYCLATVFKNDFLFLEMENTFSKINPNQFSFVTLTKNSFHFFRFQKHFSKHNEKLIKVFVDYFLENIFGN